MLSTCKRVIRPLQDAVKLIPHVAFGIFPPSHPTLGLPKTPSLSRCKASSRAVGAEGVSQRIRKRIEEAFGWIKTVAGQAKTRFRGVERVGLAFTFAAAAYNLVCLPRLLEAAQ